jgi:hypothetical protein
MPRDSQKKWTGTGSAPQAGRDRKTTHEMIWRSPTPAAPQGRGGLEPARPSSRAPEVDFGQRKGR